MSRRLRPTLRLRLTLLNGVLLIGAGAILVLLAWLLVRDALRPTDELLPGTVVLLADGESMDAAQWQRQLVDAASGELLAKGLVALLAISVVGVAGAYAVAGRALRPLHQVTATAQRLGEATLDQRIGYSGADDEVAELAKTFDAMLDRIASAFEAQKRFVANASHELRTPLAVMRTEIDVTLSDDDADAAEYRRMATVVRDASERANGLVDALLVLARSEAQAGRQLGRRTECDLAAGTANALSAMRREVERIGLRVADVTGARPGGRRPGPARPAGRQPDRERGPLQPPARPALGAHRHRRRPVLAGGGQHRLRGGPGRRAGAVRAVPPRWPGTDRGPRLRPGAVHRPGGLRRRTAAPYG